MIFKGAGIVWDAENNKPLCKFEDGIFDAKTKRDQDILKKSGYDVVKEEKE